MNNFEKIKAMNIDEMIDFLVNACRKNYCIDCKNTIRLWLESEIEEEMTNNVLVGIEKQTKELWKKQIELQEQAREYCKDKKFKIVKPIYYSGYQNNLQGRECYIKPYIDHGELLASCTVYNKKTKKIDIPHYYGHDMSFYEELKQ